MDDSQSSTNYTRQSCTSMHNVNNASSEESGWTMYLQQGCIGVDFDVENRPIFGSGSECSTLFSDAECSAFTHNSIAKRRRFNVDLELQDTATSPGHTPEKNGYITQHEEGKKVDSMETYLRRKGLCVVPMSMLLGVNRS